MDRIFDKPDVKQICEDIKKILKESDSYMEKLKSTADSAERALGQVPADTKEASIRTAASGLRSKAAEADFDSIMKKLDSYKTRATTLIPAADKQYAGDTDQLTTQIEKIRTAVSQMREFLVNTPLTARNFQALLDVESRKWNEVLDNAKKAVDKILKNVKGSEKISQVFSKDPVNLSTGNFIYDRTDLEIGGSHPFIFRRFYNSINERKGVLGRDWNHNYEVTLETEGKEKILVLEEGKEERFLLTSTGTYASLYQSNGYLKETEDGYVYQTREQDTYYFDQEGYYLRQESLDGTCIRLYYEDVCESIGKEKGETGKKRLVKVERETGEVFTFSYGEDGYLKRVADHAGRCVTYQMNQDMLIGVCTPKGYWYRYGYTPEGKLESVQNPRDIMVVENTFDGQMRTTEQKFPDGGSMSYSYNDEKREVELTERNGSKVTYVHDDKYRDTKHIYSDGEERFEYNKLNQKTLVVDKLGNKTQYGYDEKGT